MTTSVRFIAGYVGVLAVMIGWWAALQGAADVGWGWLVPVAYGGPLLAWGAVTSLSSRGRDRAEAE